MRAFRFLLAIALVAAFGTASYAQPQRLDHLKCYKVKDPANFSAAVTLQALQAQFGLEQCEMKGKGQFFCVPVDKTVTAYKDKTKPPLNGIGFIGQRLDEDRICYKIKCPKVTIPDIVVNDQFGQRPLSKFVPMMLCTPARKGTVDPVDCPGTAPQCNGHCPNPADVCRPVGPVPAIDCTCQPPPPCPDSAPVCNGDCPSIPGVPPAQCRPTADGTDCTCDTPPNPCSGTAPQCNGDCATGQKCLRTSTGCDCFDPAACHNVAPGTCGGTCQIPGQNCQIANPATGACGCVIPPQ